MVHKFKKLSIQKRINITECYKLTKLKDKNYSLLGPLK
jgi:hypothetical protein